MSREKSLVKNTAILGIGAIFSKGLVFIMLPFFSRWLTAGDYGLFDLYSTYITLLVPFMSLSSGEAVFRFLLDVDDQKDKNRIVSNGMTILAVGSFVTLIAAFVFFSITNPVIAVPFSCFLFAETINNFTLTYLRGIRRLKVYTVCNILTMVGISVFVTLFVYVLNLGLPGILYGYALGYALSSLYAMFITKFLKYLELSSIKFREIADLIKYSAPLIPNAISWWIINASDRTIINLVLGSTANGIYALAYKVPSLCTTVFSVFNLSWQESVSLSINDSDREEYFKKVFSKTLTILISICCGVLSVDFIIFHYIFDQKYIDGMVYVPILITSCIFTVISQFFGGIFIGLKEPKYNGSTTVLSAVINLVVHIALIKPLGLFAASISTLVSFIILCIVRYFIIIKRIKLCFERKLLLYIGIYGYFIVVHYLDIFVLNIVNIFVACALFLYVNKDFVKKIFRKERK